MALVFNPPPNWPKPPAGWSPTPTWRPDPAWGPVPEGWQLWIEEPEPENEQAPSTAESSSAASGSSEGSSSAKPSPSSSSEQSGESAQASAPKQRTAPTISEQFAEQKTSHQQTPEQKTQAESAHVQDAASAGSESREVAGERAGASGSGAAAGSSADSQVASGSGAAAGSSAESQVRSEQSVSETPVNRQSGTAEASKPEVSEPARDTRNAPSAPEASAQQPGVAQGSGVSYDAREPLSDAQDSQGSASSATRCARAPQRRTGFSGIRWFCLSSRCRTARGCTTGACIFRVRTAAGFFTRVAPRAVFGSVSG